jgi:o-succinylbenzoate synthase
VIRAVRLLQHRRQLASTRTSAAGTWTERRALTLVLEDDDGHFGLGEAAPLPGFSPDSLEVAQKELTALLGRSFTGRDRSRPALFDLGQASAGLDSPAARAALESALIDIWARQRNQPAWSVISATTRPRSVPVNVWLPNDTDAALEGVRSGLERGVRCFKVKLEGAGALGLQTLAALRRAFGHRVTLRADANRSFDATSLSSALPLLRTLSLEWLEEPAAEPWGQIGVPVALDESLAAGPRVLRRARDQGVVALVLKPTTLGGITRAFELVALGEAHGLVAVASHTLEGPLGFMLAATLALALGPQHAHGLAPHEGLGGVRPTAMASERDEISAWSAPGFGLSLADTLLGAEVEHEARA